MANGSSTAKSRQELVNARKARRATIRRRLITWGWIIAAGFPVAHETASELAAQEQNSSARANQDQAAENKITIVPPVARAIAVGDPNQPGAVIQTRGGLLRNVFSGNSGSSKGSKDNEDGRKAYPLPPPDPSTVNWAGVPYHTPKPGSVAATTNNADQPIRDAKNGSYTSQPSPATPMRPAATSPSSSSRTTTASRPQSLPTNNLPTVSRQPIASDSADSPRVASAAPLPPTRLQPPSPQAEFSTSSSSRRSNRRPIDPLSPGELQAQRDSEKTTASSSSANFPTVGRRPLAAPPADSGSDEGTASPELMANEEVPTVSRKTATTVPPSLSEPTTEAAVGPEERVASASPAVENKVVEQPAAVAPQPVSRTQPLSPAADAKAYPAETIAGQLSPLRPVETDDQGLDSADSVDGPEMQIETSDDAETEATDNFYGSGVAEPGKIEVQDLPGEAIQSQPTITPLQSRPLTNPSSNGAMRDAGNRSAAKPIPAAGKVVVASEIPGIRVITEGPSEILIRELTQYEVRVENRGAIDATGVIVRTALPPWAEVTGHNASTGEITPLDADSDGQVEWIIESLPAGVVERLFVRIKAVKPGSFDVATNWTSLPQTHSAKVTVREPKLAVEIEGPDEIIYGKSQKYRVRVMNPGDGLASNVVFTLAPEAEDAVEQPIGNIPAGKEASFEIELTARDQGELKIQGAASGDLDLTAMANKSVSVASAQIDATLTGPPLKYQDTDAVYQLLVSNTGTAVSESIAAEIRIPAGVEYLGGIESARLEGDRLVWNVKSLSPGESLNYEFTCKMTQTGNHSLTFNCNGTAAGRANVGLETVVEAIADLKLAVFDPPAPASVGAEVTYEIVINNRGSKAAENVRCVAQFGHGIEPVRVDGHAGDVVTGQVLFNPIARIDAGGQVKLRVIAKADKPGDHRFRAEVRSGETVLVAEEATVFVPARTERVSRSSNDPVNR